MTTQPDPAPHTPDARSVRACGEMRVSCDSGERPQDERKRGGGSVRRKPWRVHVAQEKQVFRPGGHDYEQPDGAVMREIGDDRGSRSGTARYGKCAAGPATSKS